LPLASGCSSAEPPAAAPKPCDVQVVTLNIYAADNINPNDSGNPRPVVVRLYQLKNDVRMENASYDDILLKDKEALQDDLMKVDEVSVFPNDLVEVKFERIKEASVLAGVALFHSPKGTSWKTYYGFPLLPGEAQCGGRASDGGKADADPRTAFFLESTKIDNGTQFDESMFPNATSIRKVDLPKRSSGGGGSSGPPSLPSMPSVPQVPNPSLPSAPSLPNPSLPSAPSPSLPGAPQAPGVPR
jgi:type VI secretion system protein VasD